MVNREASVIALSIVLSKAKRMRVNRNRPALLRPVSMPVGFIKFC